MAAIIYANTLVFDGDCCVDNCLQVISNWLNDKTNGRRFNAVSLGRSNSLFFANRQQVQIWASTETYPHMFAFRYSHFDEKLFGRQWITEIGLRREFDTSDIECSILLRTEDDSPNNVIPEVSRPNLVRKLIESCSLIPDIDGLSLKRLTTIDESIVDGLRAFVIDSPERRRPLVIVSPTSSGGYLLNTERLSDLLGGLASVLVIPVGSNTYRMEELVGERYTAYNGAVSIIFPSREVRGSRVVPTKKMMPEELLETFSSRREIAVLAAVTRRTNSSSYSRHISPEMVNELDLRRRIIKRREEAIEQGAQSKELDYVWDEYEKLELEKSKSDVRAAKSDEENDTLNLLLDQAQQEKENEIAQLAFKHKSELDRLTAIIENRKATAENGQLSSNVVTAFMSAMSQSSTMEESLTVIETLFPDRVVVLESAWKSAKKSSGFRHPQEAFNLLWKLVTLYWGILNDGLGDNEARSVFGRNEYSAKESETVLNNQTARELRTFNCGDERVLMEKHLKFGKKDSIAETIRIHFEWDANNKKITIGHAGPHLDFK